MSIAEKSIRIVSPEAENLYIKTRVYGPDEKELPLMIRRIEIDMDVGSLPTAVLHVTGVTADVVVNQASVAFMCPCCGKDLKIPLHDVLPLPA